MTKNVLMALTIVATFVAVLAAPANAQSRAFVAATGNDSQPCTFAAPCRTFQHAHDVLASGGEIDVLDPGGYGAITISKAISIQGHGFSGISVASGTGITISAGANDAIHLNGVLIDGTNAGSFGIVFAAGKSLSIENCIARNFTNSGLSASTGTISLVLTVSNSYFADNGSNGIILQSAGAGTLTASVDRTVLSGNGFAGLNLVGQTGGAGIKAAVTDSIAAHNKNGSNGAGFIVQTAPSGNATLVVTHSSAIGNATGISASGANAILLVGRSTVTENTAAGFSTNPGSLAVIMTYQDNYMDKNGPNSGTLTLANTQ